MKRILTCVAVSLVAISLIGCASSAQPIAEPTATANPIVSATATTTAAPTATPHPQRTCPIELGDCTIGSAAAKCGTYRVYENRSAGSGRQIDLRIAVLPATTDQVEPDPLFYFTGGPGGAATDGDLIGAVFFESSTDAALIGNPAQPELIEWMLDWAEAHYRLKGSDQPLMIEAMESNSARCCSPEVARLHALPRSFHSSAEAARSA
jgi:hypothetical protein